MPDASRSDDSNASLTRQENPLSVFLAHGPSSPVGFHTFCLPQEIRLNEKRKESGQVQSAAEDTVAQRKNP